MNPTILVVEDEPEIRQFLRSSLRAEGYRVVESPNGRRGELDAGMHKPDLAIVDLGLPDFDGVQVIRHIREWSPMPILVLSARIQERSKIEALDAGADDYVTKPFGVSELLACLAKHLGMVVTHRQLLTEVWGPTHAADTHYLRVYMKQLREKLEPDAVQPKYLLTETGVGYRLVTE